MASCSSRHWLKHIGTALVVALVFTSTVSIIRAEDSASDPSTADAATPEPTTAEPKIVTPEPTTEEPAKPAPVIVTPEPAAPVPIIVVTPDPVTPAPVVITDEPTTPAPTDAPTEMVETQTAPPDDSTTVPTDVMTDLPATDVPVTETAPTTAPTTENDGTPLSPPPSRVDGWQDTPSPTPQPDPVMIEMSVDERVTTGDTATVALTAQTMTDVHLVSALCQTDPAHLQGLAAETGDLLADATMADSGFLPNGQWVLRAQSDDALAEAGTFWTLSYRVLTDGAADVTCKFQLVDGDGNTLPLVLASLTGRIEGVPSEVPTDKATQIAPTRVVDTPVIALPTQRAPQTPVIVPTFIAPTQPPVLIPPPDVIPDTTLTAPAAPVSGDVNGDGDIDQSDVDAVLGYFDQKTPWLEPSVDINGDGMVDVYDLSIVAGSLNA